MFSKGKDLNTRSFCQRSPLLLYAQPWLQADAHRSACLAATWRTGSVCQTDRAKMPARLRMRPRRCLRFGQTNGSSGSGGAGPGPVNVSSAGQANGSSGSSSPAASSGVACNAAGSGSKRCSGAAGVEICSAGAWIADVNCNAGEVCTSYGAGQATCVKVLEVCRGRENTSVCDGQGMLTQCSGSGSAASTELCESVALCQASMPSGSCRKCLENEFRCTGVTLEHCSPDGTSFVPVRDCESEALCNGLIGDCTNQVCKPNETACQNNMLVTCNSDGSMFASMTPCNEMVCDPKGGDCNVCEPGQKQCDQEVAMTCSASGQGFEPTPCTGGQKCAGEGECVECIDDSHCAALTEGCSVGACMGSICSERPAPRGMACTTSQGRPGTCSNGTCECTPQCNKECGADGCGGQCSACTGRRDCVNDRCVECTGDGDCRDLSSDDGCVVGRCSNGTCTAANTLSSCTTDRGARGQCALGECVCAAGQGCSGKCGNAMDTCYNPCNTRCGSNQVCEDDQCVAAGVGLYEACEMGSGGQGNCGSGMTCTTFNTNTAVCWHAPPCTAPETQAFNICAIPCNTGTASCPSPTSCDGAWCVPTKYLP
jgi:hypothetical protein